MKRNRALAILGIGILLLAAGCAGTGQDLRPMGAGGELPSTSPEAEVDLHQRLIDVSGIREQVAAMPNLVKAGLAQTRMQKATPRLAEQIFEAVDVSMNAVTMRELIHSRIRQEIPPEDIPRLLVWYESPLGRKITALEVASMDPENEEEMLKALPGLLQHKDSPERMKKFQRLEKALNIPERCESG